MLFLFVFGIITCVFILKQLFAEGEVIIAEYSPRQSQDNHLAFGELLLNILTVKDTFHVAQVVCSKLPTQLSV